MVDVTVATVTYGSRHDLCCATVTAAFTAGAKHAVVIANGVSDAVYDELHTALLSLGPPISLVRIKNNLGSAGGFAEALRVAAAKASEYIWLLDDDNVPADDALRRLTKTYANARRHLGPISPIGVVGNRYQRAGESFDTQPPPGSFLYCDVIDRIRALVNRPSRNQNSLADRILEREYGPYGGLLLDKRTIEQIGYPCEDFILYEDDSEYTHRITKQGGRLFLDSTAAIADALPVWVGEDGNALKRYILTANERFLYYGLRNRCFFDTHARKGTPLRLMVNALAVMSILFAYAVRHKRLERFKLIVGALNDGRRGRLGWAKQFPRLD